MGQKDGTVVSTDKAGNVSTLRGHSGLVNSLHTHYAEQLVATGPVDHTVRLWNGKELFAISSLYGHKAPVTAVAISSDASKVVSASKDKTVRLWDVSSGKELARFISGIEEAIFVAICPHNDLILSGSATRLGLWSVERGFLCWLTAEKDWRTVFRKNGQLTTHVENETTTIVRVDSGEKIGRFPGKFSGFWLDDHTLAEFVTFRHDRTSGPMQSLKVIRIQGL